MSPLRRKGRGGGGSKTVAPIPSSFSHPHSHSSTATSSSSSSRLLKKPVPEPNPSCGPLPQSKLLNPSRPVPSSKKLTNRHPLPVAAAAALKPPPLHPSLRRLSTTPSIPSAPPPFPPAQIVPQPNSGGDSASQPSSSSSSSPSSACLKASSVHSRLPSVLCRLQQEKIPANTATAVAPPKEDKERIDPVVVSSQPRVVAAISSTLHERLALLEDRVSQIASELSDTRKLLDPRNPGSSRLLLSDIQGKINAIEKAISTGMDDDRSLKPSPINQNPCRSSEGEEEGGEEEEEVEKAANLTGFNSSKLEETRRGGDTDLVEYASQSSASIKRVMSSYGHEELEERLFPHRKLLKNRTSLSKTVLESRAALHAQISDSSSPVQTGYDLGYLQENLIMSSGFGNQAYDSDPSIKLDYMPNSNLKQTSFEIPVTVLPPIEGGSIGGTPAYLECEESLPSNDVVDDRENIQPNPEVNSYQDVGYEDLSVSNDLTTLGLKNATAGWFASDGDAVVLAHEDGSCSYFDVANMEEKAEYKSTVGVPPAMWEDCWLIRAAASDGRLNKYIVAASAGNALDSGFCCWDLYTKELVAYHNESSSLKTNTTSRREPLQPHAVPFWYRPCGPLMAGAASFQTRAALYDIRDGETLMKWDTKGSNIAGMEICSPIQWRNKGKLAIAEEGGISFWDVNSLDAQHLNYVDLSSEKPTAFHVLNADAENSGGVRQRYRSSESDIYDAVVCTQQGGTIIDLRLPTGIALTLPVSLAQSVYIRGEVVLLGGRGIEEWCMRMPNKPVCEYLMPDLGVHVSHAGVRQVWCSSEVVMGVNGNGLFVFPRWSKEEGMGLQEVQEVLGSNDLYNPSFDYACGCALLISRDRPANWCYWP